MFRNTNCYLFMNDSKMNKRFKQLNIHLINILIMIWKPLVFNKILFSKRIINRLDF